MPELQTKLTECKAEQYDLLKLIDSFSGYENQILKMKYVQGKSLEEIAAELGYSYETVRAKHAELHRRLDWIDEWEDRRTRLENRLDY
ncbi:phage protein [Lacticaseibacillus paracasei subsp. paracasei Lpp223]|nr:phage protein [Lacticaseibacillus paracasei subsp. paracasei Lpp223]